MRPARRIGLGRAAARGGSGDYFRGMSRRRSHLAEFRLDQGRRARRQFWWRLAIMFALLTGWMGWLAQATMHDRHGPFVARVVGAVCALALMLCVGQALRR
jgi:hypothetical protein